MNVLSNQDCWTLAYVSQFSKLINDDEKQTLIEKLSEYGKKLVKLMFDVISGIENCADSKDLDCVNGFLNWAKNLSKNRAKNNRRKF